MRPISNTAAIFVTGREAASFRRRWAKVGISFGLFSLASSVFSSSVLLASSCCMILSLVENIWKRIASHIFAALGVSLLSSRDQPLSFDFMPFGFGMTFRRGLAAGREASCFSTADSVSCRLLTFAPAESSFPVFSLSTWSSCAGALGLAVGFFSCPSTSVEVGFSVASL
uniref:Uncharacterized protein n=1 Tax=Electrophorus electricus TaxID=8005 RepID=A0AAY5ET87_ELEEL